MEEFTQVDRDMLKSHDIKICTVLKTQKEGFKELGKKIDASMVACPTIRADCRKEVDEKMHDEIKEQDKKIAAKVDWKYLGVILTFVTIVLGILKYTT